MINNKAELKEYLKAETGDFHPKAMLRIPFDLYEQQVIHKYLRILRITEYHINKDHKFRKWYYVFRLKRKQLRYGVHIPPNCFEKGLSIAHTGGILVNGDCRVGEYCRIHSGVKLVAGANGVPCIGNHVYFGVGSCVIGNVKIADGCTIGANAVVCKSFEHRGAVLVGVPAKESKIKECTWDGKTHED